MKIISFLKSLTGHHIILPALLPFLLMNLRQSLLEHIVLGLGCGAIQVKLHIQPQLMDWRQ